MFTNIGRQAALVGLIAIFATSLLAVVTNGQPRREARTNVEAARVFAEFERGGIPAAAAVYGIYRSQAPFGSVVVAEDALALSRASDAVLVGIVRTGSPRLTDDQRSIVTEFRVTIEQVFKGEHRLHVDDQVLVSVPGGRIELPDGAIAEVVLATGELPLKDGRRYLLFLELLPTEEPDSERGGLGSFQIANQEGVFELAGSPSRLVAYRPTLPVAMELRALGSSENVLERIRAASRKSVEFPDARRLP